MRRILALVVAALLATVPSYAAGTVTVSETTIGSIKLVKFTWTSSAGGAADGATTLTYDGGIQRIVTVPDGGGTQPTDLYDITLLDGNGVDVLVANGANRSNTATEQVPGSALGITVASALTLHVTNAGNAKGGVVYVYVATGATNAGIPLPSPVTAYAVLTGGTTSTAPLQQVSGLGTAAQVLTSNGAGALPTWQATSAAGHVVLGATHTDSLAGTVVLGDVIHGNATPKWARLGGNTTTTRKFLRQTGDGAVSAAPAWDTVTQTDVGLSAVENTALSTWAGTANITTLGTVATGAWNATAITVAKGGTGAAPGADDQLLVSDSTSAATWRAVGDCDDSGGKHLNYDTGTNAFSCGTSGATSAPFVDTTSIVEGSADNTKEIRFEVDGLTTGTVRVLTPPDANIVLTGSAAALTSGRSPYVTTGGLLLDSANLTYAEAGGANTVTLAATTTDVPRLYIEPGGTGSYGYIALGTGTNIGNINIIGWGTAIGGTLAGITRAGLGSFYCNGTGSTGCLFGSTTADPVYFVANDLERARINSTGEFGILKTATAGVELDVAGDIAASGNVSANGAGSAVLLAAKALINTAPTIAAGFCTTPSISASNGTAAFAIAIGTSCAGVTTGSLTMPAATTGWSCSFANVTTPASFIVSQTGGTGTTVTLTNYSRTTGLAVDFTASESIRALCLAY